MRDVVSREMSWSASLEAHELFCAGRWRSGWWRWRSCRSTSRPSGSSTSTAPACSASPPTCAAGTRSTRSSASRTACIGRSSLRRYASWSWPTAAAGSSKVRPTLPTTAWTALRGLLTRFVPGRSRAADWDAERGESPALVEAHDVHTRNDFGYCFRPLNRHLNEHERSCSTYALSCYSTLVAHRSRLEQNVEQNECIGSRFPGSLWIGGSASHSF